MKPSESQFIEVRALKYHVRTWGHRGQPPLFLLHGWMDVSGSFQFLVDCLQRDWYVIAPDWRGFGLSEWERTSYWFADYYADLDVLLDRFQPAAPVNVIGHSLGGNVASTYAGIRPERIARLVSLEGLGLARTIPENAPKRLEKWLDQLKDPPRFKVYASFAEVAGRLKRSNPRLTDERAEFLARQWARQTERGVEFVSDPRHKTVNPYLYQVDEMLACWRRITAPVLHVSGKDSHVVARFKEFPEDLAHRKAAFRDWHEVELDDCGHMMHHDQPERLAQVIEDFL